jgi:hypothetical protein
MSGRIVTFYSYKGGTGRTMALANVAWILASNGHRVLTIDWDLEAPGLHRFFGPALLDPDQSTQEGLLDFLREYIEEATRTPAQEAPDAPPWYQAFTNLKRFAQPVDTGFARGRLDMVGAGRQNAAYAKQVNTFDWRAFYERFRGGAFLDATFARLREHYDYVLIDSRTGVSDTSGICTVQLPDALVVMFTLNTQSIEGASAIAADALAQREGKRELKVLPVPTRVELAEFDRLQAARVAARQRFEPLVRGLGADYLEEMEVRHVPYYLYGEQLAAVVEAGRARILLGNYEKLCGLVTDGAVTKLALQSSDVLEATRARFKSGPLGTTAAPPVAPAKRYDVFIAYGRPDADIARRLFAELRGRGLRVFLDVDALSPGDNVKKTTEDALRDSTAAAVIFAASVHEDTTPLRIAAAALQRQQRVIPIAIGDVGVPTALDGVSRIKLPRNPSDNEILEIAIAIHRVFSGPTQATELAERAQRADLSRLVEQLRARGRRYLIVAGVIAVATLAIHVVTGLAYVRADERADDLARKNTSLTERTTKFDAEKEALAGFGADYIVKCEQAVDTTIGSLVTLQNRTWPTACKDELGGVANLLQNTRRAMTTRRYEIHALHGPCESATPPNQCSIATKVADKVPAPSME